MSEQTTELQPSILVIFGITGDLAQRYLLPSLYHLFQEKLLHEDTQIIGLTRQAMTAEELYNNVELCINETDNICDPVAIETIRSKTELLQFDPANATDYPKLAEKLASVEAAHGVSMNRLYYLSIPPKVFKTIITNLGEAGLNKHREAGLAQTRILVEKPFGSDLASAQDLIEHTAQVFDEEQVFRIDHYVAKETVQNILTFRAENPIFASIWDNEHVTSIDILASEKIGIENRVQFYEGVGAVRDLIQSHLLQLLAITTMDIPVLGLQSGTIHAAKQALLEAVEPVEPKLAVRGQYDSYTSEVANPNSSTETFARLQFQIANRRWQGVPITITTGKALSERLTEITVTFSDPHEKSDSTNALTFRIQPNEGIHLQLRVKKPGFQQEDEEALMDFNYKDVFGVDSNHPSAYERVLVDAVRGDRTLFATSAEVLASWQIIEPIIDAWKNNTDGMQTYQRGSTGPTVT